MYEVGLIIVGFEDYRKKIFKELVEAWARINLLFIKDGKVPPFYSAKIEYKDEDPDGENPFLNCLAVIKNGGADCKSLVAYRLAELWFNGIDAECVFSDYQQTSTTRLSHVLIKHPNGYIEDPSKRLGM